MSPEPEPNPRTVSLGQHHIETAVAFWRNAAGLVEREPEPRRAQYRRAVAEVLATLQAVTHVPGLLAAYYTVSQERLDALARACETDSGFPLSRGITEDCAYHQRFQEIVAASKRGGPFPQRSEDATS